MHNTPAIVDRVNQGNSMIKIIAAALVAVVSLFGLGACATTQSSERAGESAQSETCIEPANTGSRMGRRYEC